MTVQDYRMLVDHAGILRLMVIQETDRDDKIADCSRTRDFPVDRGATARDGGKDR